jgi:hypothetical protein
MKRLAATLTMAVALAGLAGTAEAAPRTIWHDTSLDPAASTIAGFPISVYFSDNIAEWNLLTGTPAGPYVTLGFTYTLSRNRPVGKAREAPAADGRTSGCCPYLSRRASAAQVGESEKRR